MKKTIIIILIFINAVTFAQISDTEAKVIYQQTEDLYNNDKFYDASQKAILLKEKMGDWTPKVLYIHLKSAYMSFIDKDLSSSNYPVTKRTFLNLEKNCETFFNIVDKNTYPHEKYIDVQNMVIFFKKKKEENDVPIEATINLLSSKLEKWPSDKGYKNNTHDLLTIRNHLGFESLKPLYDNDKSTVKFKLIGDVLYVIAIKSKVFKKYQSFDYKIDRIDFSKVTAINQDGTLFGETKYNEKGVKSPVFFESCFGSFIVSYEDKYRHKPKKYNEFDFSLQKMLETENYEEFLNSLINKENQLVLTKKIECDKSQEQINALRYFEINYYYPNDIKKEQNEIIKLFNLILDYTNESLKK